MMWKLWGAVLIISGCSAFGFRITNGIRREEQALRQLICALDYMQCELQYRMTPLPDLCRQAGLEQKNRIGQFFGRLSVELESQVSSDVSSCVHNVLTHVQPLPSRAEKALELLGASLGRFDSQGQIHGIGAVRSYCRTELEEMSVNRDARLRSYQTLGICAGAALAILFI